MKAVAILFHSVFYFLLNMSITASLMCVMILIIRGAFGRWVSKSAVYYMWGIVLLRMIVPVSIPSGFSFMNFINRRIIKSVDVPKVSGSIPDMSILNSIQAVREYFPLEYKSNTLEAIFKASSIVWICGAALFIIASIVMYSLTTSKLKKAVLVRDNDILDMLIRRFNIREMVQLYESGFVVSPIVFGITKPRIIISKDMEKEALEFVLLHELQHIKGFDNLLKLLSVFAVCIHWFNPFAWIFLYKSGQDMELACDEKVLKGMSRDERRNYADALLSLAAKQQAIVTAFGSTAVKSRIMNIAAYKRVSIIMVAATGVLCIAIAVVLLTNPVL